MLDLAPRPLPLLTAALPGTGGASKVVPEDFLVEEIPAYLPGGSGEHLYVHIEKRDLSTRDAARLVAEACGVTEREVGYAGQKDRRAITRQWLSVLTKKERVELTDPRLRVIEAARHGNKLRLGHTRGNRFSIVLRGTGPDADARARTILAELAQTGLPNFFGAQRFGRNGDNAALGAALLGIGTHPELARARKDRFLKRLALSALQSELFNRVLATRLRAGTWTTVLPGDVLRKRATGGVFVSPSPDVDQPRVDSGEVDVTGPLPGHQERPAAAGASRDIENAVLSEAGVPREALALGGDETQGARRPLRIPLEESAVEPVSPDAVRLSFTLPSGAYATRVLAEITREGVDLPAEE